MGSPFVSYEWAATRLARSKRMIHNYIGEGFLTRHFEAGKPVLRRDEVEALKVEIDSHSRIVNRKTVILLEQRIKRLEEEMSLMKRILEVRDSALRPTQAEAVGLMAAAADALGRRTWTLEEIHLWAEQFDKMDEITFDAFAQAAPGNSRPWLDFYKLCLDQIVFVDKSEGLECQALSRRLNEGRKRLRSNVLVWVELGRGTVPDSVFSTVDTPKERLLKRVVGG